MLNKSANMLITQRHTTYVRTWYKHVSAYLYLILSSTDTFNQFQQLHSNDQRTERLN